MEVISRRCGRFAEQLTQEAAEEVEPQQTMVEASFEFQFSIQLTFLDEEEEEEEEFG